MSLRSMLARIARLERQARLAADYTRYSDDPVGYCRDVLRVTLSPRQEEVAKLLTTPPYKVLVRAGHNVGKSFLAACLVSWWFDCRKGICLTTAPTDRQVKDILWKEVRRVRDGAGLAGFAGPKVCRLEASPTHFAHGFTARDGSRFQGHHADAVLIVFDEAEGVDRIFWEAAETMLGGRSFAMIAIYNPTLQSSPTAEAERQGGWHQVTMSCLDHPNITAELRGLDPPYPSAIRLDRLRSMLDQWSTPVAAGQQQLGDVEVGGRWYRPGPVAEARILGRRPSMAFDAVWADVVFDLCEKIALPEGGPIQIGLDVARFGDDFTCWHVRRGGNSLAHVAVNGWPIDRVAEHTKVLCGEWGKRVGLDPKQVPVAVDDSGVGGGVTDIGRRDGYLFIGLNGGQRAANEMDYPNLRSALWFDLADAAARGQVSVRHLPQQARTDLRRELTAPVYSLDARGRRVVEPKERTKQRLGRSPDNADAMLNAYASVQHMGERLAGRIAA